MHPYFCGQIQHMLFSKFLLTATLLLAIYFLSAQEKMIELEPAVVTANIGVQKQKETGRNIFVIKGELLSGLPVHSIDELLRYLPGIEVQQRGPQGSQSDIVIRGGTFQQVLVIIDGVKINDPLTGHFTAYTPVHPAEIERIEILKGAASAIYGSDAVGGVIHIITKTFSGSKNSLVNAIKAKAAAGEKGLLNGDAYFNWSKNKSTISAGALSNNATGPQLRGTTGFFHLSTAHLSWSQQLRNHWKISLRSAADFRNFNAQNYYTTFVSDTAREKVNSWWNHLHLEQKTNHGELNIDVAYKQLRDQFWFRKTSAQNDNRTNLFTAQLNYSFALAEKHDMTSGFQFSRKQIKSNDRGNHNLWHGAAFVVLRHHPGKNFSLNESLRFDWDENYGLVVIPQLNAAWSPSKLTLRTSVGKSIRDADFTERYNNYNKPVVRSGSIGNPDLTAEKALNVEAGFDYNFSAGIKLSGTFFYKNQNDLIDWSPTPYAAMPRQVNLVATGTYALAKNIKNVNTTGTEIDILFKKKFSDKINLFSTTGFIWLNSESDNAVPSFYISSHAKYLVNFSHVLSVSRFVIALTGVYKKRNEQKAAAIGALVSPSYLIINTRAACRFLKNKATIFIQADNLFNKRYSDLLGSVMPGRWLSAGFEIALAP